MKDKEQKPLNKAKKGYSSSSNSKCTSPCQRRSTTKCSPAAKGSLQLRQSAGQRDGALIEMTIIIQTLTGKSITQTVTNNTTIRQVKTRICESEGIAIESQQLVFKDKQLSDLDTLKSLGIVSGNTIKLVVTMAGGPGLYAQKSKADDPIFLLLGRQNEELYMLEFYMGDDQPKPILLKGPSGKSLESMMGESSTSDEIEEFIEGSEEDDDYLSDSLKSTSTFSTSTVFSFFSNGTSKIISRPSSSNSLTSASSILLEEFLSAATNSSSLPLQYARPATAISIMRLPISSPLIILPKSRPASAVVTSSIISPVSSDVTSFETIITKKSIDPLKNENLETAKVVEQINHQDCTEKIKEFISDTHHACCSLCKKKHSFSFKCKCGKIFCSLHRYSDRHSCTFDYAEEHRKTLRSQLPLVNGEKVINL